METVEHLGAPLHRARVERGGQEFALVPGGTVTLGFDPERWRPAPEQEVDYRESLERGFGHGPDLRSHLALLLSPRRTVTLGAVLMAVEDERLTEPPAAVPALLAARGLRMPGPDEWEHACGAGADTLFRWGDECPLDRIPYDHLAGPQRELNALGPRIAYDAYRSELTSGRATAHRGHPGYAALVYGEFSVRPVLG